VGVGADERVGEGDAVTLFDDPCQELEVDLMADAGAGRHDLEAAERLLAPAQEEVALVVPFELELHVPSERNAGREGVDLDGVIDHELDRDQRIDLRGIAAEIRHRVPHRGEVDDGGHAGQVLEQDARRHERDLL